MIALLLGQPLWYWAVFLLVAAIVLVGPVCSILEWLADERDREVWESRPGAVTTADRRVPAPWPDDFLPVSLTAAIDERDRDLELWDAVAERGRRLGAA